MYWTAPRLTLIVSGKIQFKALNGTPKGKNGS